MAYAYCADIYCDDCGRAAIAECKLNRVANSGDTDEYPQWLDDAAEADTPQHCGNHEHCLNAQRAENRLVGCFLGNDLTTDGRDYVADAIAQDIMEGATHSVARQIWEPYYLDDAMRADIVKLLVADLTDYHGVEHVYDLLAAEYGPTTQPEYSI